MNALFSLLLLWLCCCDKRRNLFTFLPTLLLSIPSAATAFQFGNKRNEKKEPIMRAWTCHGRNQVDLVQRLTQAGIVKSEPVKKVLQAVDRIHYCATSKNAYQDAPQPLGLGQTISAPHMHAHVLEEILPYLQKVTDRPLSVLDVGCGSGYLTACLGRWMRDGTFQKGGTVVGIDIYPHLVERATQNMKKADADLLSTATSSSLPTVQFHEANGWMGWPANAPFDAIHVGAAADGFPTELANQLALGGVLICPIGSQKSTQVLTKIVRVQQPTTNAPDNRFQPEDFQVTQLLGVRYVPLIDGPGGGKDVTNLRP